MKDFTNYKDAHITLGGKKIITFTEYCNHIYKSQERKTDFHYWALQNRKYLIKEWDLYVARVHKTYLQEIEKSKPYTTKLMERIVRWVMSFRLT